MAPVSAVPLSPVVDEPEAQTLVEERAELTSRGDNVTGVQDGHLAEQVREGILEVLVGDGHVVALERLDEHRAAELLDVGNARIPRSRRGQRPHDRELRPAGGAEASQALREVSLYGAHAASASAFTCASVEFSSVYRSALRQIGIPGARAPFASFARSAAVTGRVVPSE